MTEPYEALYPHEVHTTKGAYRGKVAQAIATLSVQPLLTAYAPGRVRLYFAQGLGAVPREEIREALRPLGKMDVQTFKRSAKEIHEIGERLEDRARWNHTT